MTLGNGLATWDVRRLRGLYRPRTPVRVVSVDLAIPAVRLGARWAVVPLQNAVSDGVPAGSTLVETGLVVPLGVPLDLASLVPAYAVAAVQLWRHGLGHAPTAVLVVSGLVHQVCYPVAMPMKVAAEVPGAKAIDPAEPFMAALFLIGAVLMVGGVRDERRERPRQDSNLRPTD